MKRFRIYEFVGDRGGARYQYQGLRFYDSGEPDVRQVAESDRDL